MTEEYLTDDEQLEAVKHMAVEYAPWLIGGVLTGALLFFGYRYYETYTNDRALKASAQFGAMNVALQANNPAKSRQIAEGLIKDYANSPYADQAQLILARLDVDEGRPDRAIAPLNLVMDNSKDADLRQIARLRLARILIDQGKPDEAIKTLAEPIPASFAARYREVRGDAFLAKKDTAHALAEYRQALGAAGMSGMNASLLELKIQDLGAVPTPVVNAVSVDSQLKGNP